MASTLDKGVLTLPDSGGTPSNPAAGNNILYYYNTFWRTLDSGGNSRAIAKSYWGNARELMPKVMLSANATPYNQTGTTSNVGLRLMPNPVVRRPYWISGTSTNFFTIGTPAITGSGTLAQNTLSQSTMTNATTAATTGTAAGFNATVFNLTRFARNPSFFATFTCAETTQFLIWIGLFSAAPGNNTNPAVSYIAFRINNGSMTAVTGNGVSQTVSSLLFPSATTTDVQRISFQSDSGGNVYFTLESPGQALQTKTISATLPSVSTPLAPVALIYTGANVAKVMSVGMVGGYDGV